MAYTIALSGKGGTGKTTIAALLLQLLLHEKRGSVLAVDADPNYNLGSALGVEVKTTIADIREQLMQEKLTMSQDISKERIVEYGIQKVLEERNGFALLTMGRPEGQGCYCFINTVLRKYLDVLSKNYSFVIIDNEAGMEHLSRKTTNNVDHLIITALPERASILAAERIAQIASSLPITIRKISVIFNNVRTTLPEYILKKVKEIGLPVLTNIQYDTNLERLLSEGKSLYEIAPQTEPYKTLLSIKEKILAPLIEGFSKVKY